MISTHGNTRAQRFWFHWQNLNDKPFGRQGSGLRHGRCWWHFADRRTIGFSWNFWTNFCHLSFRIGDEWQFSVAIPPIAFWLHFEGFQLLRKLTPQKKCIARWDNNREFYIPDERECEISIHDWTIWIKPWSKEYEWNSKDPWWVRGVNLNLKDLLLGRTKYTVTAIETFSINIPMPEGSYQATVKVEHRTWKRPRWFTHEQRDASVDIPGGIPFPGKGENSYDCGMDGLFGYGCDSLKREDIIAKGVQSVLEYRRRYGGSVDWLPPSEAKVD
jgi:hypothetical protein